MARNKYEIIDDLMVRMVQNLWYLTTKGIKKLFEKEVNIKNRLWGDIFHYVGLKDKNNHTPQLINITCNVGGSQDSKKSRLNIGCEKYTFISKITFSNIIKHKEQLECYFNRDLELTQKSFNSFEIKKIDILAKKQNEIEKILNNLGIEAKLFKKNQTKLSTNYYLTVDNFSKVESVKRELAFKLKQNEKDIRIVPEKGTCKIVVKKHNSILSFLDIYQELENKLLALELPVIYGIDQDDNYIVEDMKDTLNMIIAGSTGFGKSVFIHSLIISLLKAKNNSLLYLFDPKGNELYDYQNHDRVIFADNKDHMLEHLKKLEILMRERNEEMKGNAKNIIEWNKKQTVKWPWIVVVIDEIADIMVETEEHKERANEIKIMITKLSQMGRSAGIRLVLCTQKPNKDIIDTLIKANCITRVSFKTSNGMESRIILDKDEAQNLKKPGEMIALLNSDYKHIKAPYMDQKTIDNLIKML